MVCVFVCVSLPGSWDNSCDCLASALRVTGGSSGESLLPWPSLLPLTADAAAFLLGRRLVNRLVSGVSFKQSSVTVLSKTVDLLSGFPAGPDAVEDT